MITWKIKNTRRNVDTGLVTMVSVELSSSEENVSIEHQVDVALPLNDPASRDFVLFDQLTEDQVLDWAKQTLTAEGVASAEADAIAKLQQKISPITANGLPWVLNNESLETETIAVDKFVSRKTHQSMIGS